MANFNSEIVTEINTANNLQGPSEYLGNIKYIPVKFTDDHADMTGDTVTLTGTLPEGTKVVEINLRHTAIASANQVDIGTSADPDKIDNNVDISSAGNYNFPYDGAACTTAGKPVDVGNDKIILTFNAGAMSSDAIEGYILVSTGQ